MKLGVFLPNWIGDAVMATPALRALRNKFAGAELVGIAKPVIEDVFRGSALLDRVLVHDAEGTAERRGLGFVRALRAEQFDLLLLLTNSFRTGWLAWLSGAARRVGANRNGRGWMLTDAIDVSKLPSIVSALDYYLALIEPLGCETTNKQTELSLTDADEEARRDFLATLDRRVAERPAVVLNSGGAFGSAKHWPIESFAELARRIVDRFERHAIVLCGPAERDAAREIVRLADRPGVTTPAGGNLSLGLSKALVRHADLMVTTDSGPRHFAQPFGVPVITLFGPTHIGLSETYGPRAVHLQLAVDCGPCQQRVCPLEHHRCMRELTVDRVFQAVCRQLDAAHTRAA